MTIIEQKVIINQIILYTIITPIAILIYLQKTLGEDLNYNCNLIKYGKITKII